MAETAAESRRTKRRRREGENDALTKEVERLKKLVDKLEYEAQRLEGKRSVLTKIPWQEIRLCSHRSQRIAWKYVKMFEHGYKIKDEDKGHQQEMFLRSICQEDMAFCGSNWQVRGVDKLITSFRLYCSSHLNYTMHCNRVKIVRNDDDTGDVVCELDCMVSQRLTRETIANYYPQILHLEDIVQKLIGSDIAIETVVILGFNPFGRIETFTTYMLREKAFAKMLGIDIARNIVIDHQYKKHMEVG